MRKLAAQSDSSQPARQFHLELESKADTQFEANNLFANARANRTQARASLKKLFVQAPVATTMAPNLQPELDKMSSVELSIEMQEQLGLVKRAYQVKTSKKRTLAEAADKTCPMKKTATKRESKTKKASVAPHVDAWFEKNAHLLRSEAQNRFPELLKVAAEPKLLASKIRRSPTSGPTPVQSALTGGSA